MDWGIPNALSCIAKMECLDSTKYFSVIPLNTVLPALCKQSSVDT